MDITNAELQRKLSEFVSREVVYCVSTLVYDLTRGEAEPDYEESNIELWRPVVGEDAYCEAAEAAGWTGPHKDEFGATYFKNDDGSTWCAATWEELCREHDIDNAEEYAGEVYEHWIVSTRFADKLEVHGERIVRDWHGLMIWARTTTGQAIAMDGVIADIYAELHTKR